MITKKNKLLFSVIILILCSAVFFIIDSIVLKKNTIITVENTSANNKDQRISNSFSIADIDKEVKQETKVDLPVISYINADIETISTMHSKCGYSFISKQNAFSRIKDINKLTDKQNIAKNKLLDKCDKWYDFINNLSKEQLEIQTKVFDDYGDLIEHMNPFTNKNINNNQILKDSKDTLRNKVDSSMVTIGALANLLNQDYEFMGEIAENIGTQNLKFFADNSYYIAFLYACEVAPQECSQNSMQMLSLCVNNEQAYGYSYADYYATTVSQNQFADMMNTVSAIIQLINQGYFD